MTGPTDGSVADAVLAVRPYLPAGLVTGDAVDRIVGLTQVLPGALTTYLGFECHLGDRPPHTDLALRVKQTEPGRPLLAGTGRNDGWSRSVRPEPVWARLAFLAHRWGDGDDDTNRLLAALWLELDIDDDADEADPLAGGPSPVPSVFLTPTEAIGPHRHDVHTWVTREAVPTVLGRPLPASTARQVTRALATLPEPASVYQVGVMTARGSEAVRLCVSGLPVDGVAPYLRGLGWAGEAAQLHTLVSELTPLTRRLGVVVEVGDTAHDTVGLECFLGRRWPQVEPRWPVLLDHLVRAALCTPQQRAALLAYPGFAPPAEGPTAGQRAAAALLGGRAAGGYLRRLNHVKVTCAPGLPPQAKAYVSAAHAWRLAVRPEIPASRPSR